MIETVKENADTFPVFFGTMGVAEEAQPVIAVNRNRQGSLATLGLKPYPLTLTLRQPGILRGAPLVMLPETLDLSLCLRSLVILRFLDSEL
ncbi:MAG TPA: hypothetical protein VKW06_10580 [Candidatus Angelobacter sp.]|nr:hypothetical protein [Candidatus Angelobacter sp.]